MKHESDCAQCALRTQGLCSMLTDSTQAELASCSRMQVIPPNTTVWDDDRRTDFVGVLISGYLRYQRYGIDGRRQILCLLQPGDIVGDPQDEAEGYSLETSTEVRLCRFDRRRFERLEQDHPDLARSLYRMRAARLEKLRWLTWSLGVLSADERLCAFLARATTHMPFDSDGAGGGTLTVLPCRRDIADLLATTVESISRTTQKLASAGVLEILSPVRFRIPDLNRLAALGGDSAVLATAPVRPVPPVALVASRAASRAGGGRTPIDCRQCAEPAIR